MTDPITGIAIVDWLLALLDQWGYLIVFGISIFENLFVVGSFTPGETFVMAGAFLASRGTLSLLGIWTAAVLGSIIGSNISYWLGRRGGRDALLRYGAKFRVSEQRIVAAEVYFYKHGSKTVFLARFAAGVKNFVPMIAGVTKMGVFWFELWTGLGAVLYSTLMCAIGYFIGENFDSALAIASRIGLVGLALVVIVVIVVVIGGRRLQENREEHLIAEEEAECAEESGLEGELSSAEEDRPEDNES